MKRFSKKMRENPALRSVLVVLAVIIVYTIYTMIKGGNAVGFTWKDTGVLITAPEETAAEVLYEEIENVELIDKPDYGECLEGGKNSTWNYGTWRNEIWGTYQLFVKQKLDTCIVLKKMDGSVLVINSETDKVTAAMYENLLTIISGS